MTKRWGCGKPLVGCLVVLGLGCGNSGSGPPWFDPFPGGVPGSVTEPDGIADVQGQTGGTQAGSSSGAPAGWRIGTSMPAARTELAAAVLDGQAYVAGGYGGYTTFEAYDIAQDRWRALADLPVGMEHPCLAALNGLVYLSCGDQERLFAYDPATDRWTPRASMPTVRWGSIAVALDGALYVVGGRGPEGLTIQRYDPEADRWSAVAQLDMVRDHSVSVVIDGKIYVLGGRPGRGAVYDSSVIYDPADGSVTPGPTLDEGRSGFAAAVLGPYLCVAGGEVLVRPVPRALDTAACLDLESGIWSAADTLPRPLHGVASIGYEGRLIVFGGASTPGSATPRVGGVYILEP